MTVLVGVQPDRSFSPHVQEPDVVYLIGTAHVSRQSAEEVQRVIQAVRPQNVVVELCSSRTAVMYDDPADSDGGAAASGPEADAAAGSSNTASSRVADEGDSAAAATDRRASAARASTFGHESRASNPMALR